MIKIIEIDLELLELTQPKDLEINQKGIVITQILKIEKLLKLAEKYTEEDFKELTIELFKGKKILTNKINKFTMHGPSLTHTGYLKEDDKLLMVGTMTKITNSIKAIIETLYILEEGLILKITRKNAAHSEKITLEILRE